MSWRKDPGFHEWEDSSRKMLGERQLSQSLSARSQSEERFGQRGEMRNA